MYKNLYYTACSFLPVTLLKRVVSATTLLPYHHLVSDKEVLHVKHLYTYKNTSQFKKDLDVLLKYFRPAVVSEIVESVVEGKSLPKNSFLLSFDDGFREIYDVIAPILYAKGVPAVFFINPAFLDNKQLFYRCKISLVIDKLIQKKDDKHVLKTYTAIMEEKPFQSVEKLIMSVKKMDNLDEKKLDQLANELEISFEEYLKNQQPFLTTQQVKELGNKGFSIGAHSWDHPYYHLISEEEKQRQTISSSLYIRKEFSPEYNLFAFPHSDKQLSQDFFDKIISSGADIDIFFGIQNQKVELNNKVLHRFNAERPWLPMKKQLNGMLFLMLFRKLFHRHKIMRTKLLKGE